MGQTENDHCPNMLQALQKSAKGLGLGLDGAPSRALDIYSCGNCWLYSPILQQLRLMLSPRQVQC